MVIVEDVITTGGSVRDLIRLVQDAGASVVGVGAILDRSGGQVDLGVPVNPLFSKKMPSYQPDACPLCKQGGSPVKPGSR